MSFNDVFVYIYYAFLIGVIAYMFFSSRKHDNKFKKTINELEIIKKQYIVLIKKKNKFLEKKLMNQNELIHRELLISSSWHHYGKYDVHYYSIWILMTAIKDMDEVGEKIEFFETAFSYGFPKWILHDISIGQRNNCDSEFMIFEYKHNTDIPLDEKELEEYK